MMFAVIPAGGHGSRMASTLPKQYMMLHGRSVLWHTLQPFLRRKDIFQIVVVVAANDPYYAQVQQELCTFNTDTLAAKVIFIEKGGDNRAASVQAGVHYGLSTMDAKESLAWVLVHDAARPCLSDEALHRLIDTVLTAAGGDRVNAMGGLLALPVADTVKRSKPLQTACVQSTVSRDDLWLAQTPQMFPCHMLADALSAPQASITDESSAMEAMGGSPWLVLGDPMNLKITRPHDLRLAALFLSLMESKA